MPFRSRLINGVDEKLASGPHQKKTYRVRLQFFARHYGRLFHIPDKELFFENE